VTLDPEPIYVHDRGVYTSAGSTASIDLVLGLVEEDFGRRVAHADPSGVGQVVAGLKLRFCG
jgi:transcriptional regulator GlxA family with amidase domain